MNSIADEQYYTVLHIVDQHLALNANITLHEWKAAARSEFNSVQFSDSQLESMYKRYKREYNARPLSKKGGKRKTRKYKKKSSKRSKKAQKSRKHKKSKKSRKH